MASLVLARDAVGVTSGPRPGSPAAGLLAVAAIVAAGFAGNRIVPSASPLLFAMGLGVLCAPLVRQWPATARGIELSATRLLRVGVALLGLRISVAELAGVGIGGIAVAAGTIAATMTLVAWLGRRLGLSRQLSLLIATGTAVCGASAIAAMDAVVRAREEEVSYAVATVTVFGTLAMLALPPLSGALGLNDVQAGMWAGGSIHEVAQATAAGAVISAGALKVATLVKLCRVAMLAPVLALAGGRHRAPARAPLPGFVVGFLACVAVRSSGEVPAGVLDLSSVTATVLLAAGLAALGLRVNPRALRAAGLRPLTVGVAAWAIAAGSALALVQLVG